MSPNELQQACLVARKRLETGKVAEAELLLKTLCQRVPDAFPALVLFAQLREAQGKAAEAIQLYEQASRAVPGHAYPFTRRALLLLRGGKKSASLSRLPVAAAPFVSMGDLGSNGRFGNQLLQYAALRIYARQASCVVAAPDWLGRELFGLQDPVPPSLAGIPTLNEDETSSVLKGLAPAKPNVDLTGYFCADPGLWRRHAEAFRACFHLTEPYAGLMQTAVSRLRSRGKTVVALHLRRGDFGTGRYWIAPAAWYLEWLDNNWASLDNPVLYLATDDRNTAADFARYSPLLAEDLGPLLKGAEFLTDHTLLREADHLLCSNSTFSMTAALLNTKAAGLYRPDRGAARMRACSPWTEPILED